MTNTLGANMTCGMRTPDVCPRLLWFSLDSTKLCRRFWICSAVRLVGWLSSVTCTKPIKSTFWTIINRGCLSFRHTSNASLTLLPNVWDTSATQFEALKFQIPGSRGTFHASTTHLMRSNLWIFHISASSWIWILFMFTVSKGRFEALCCKALAAAGISLHFAVSEVWISWTTVYPIRVIWAAQQ